jgi:putative ABC transport system permease protein
MFRTTLAGLRAHARRMVATALAVIFGVAFVAGTFFFRDTATAGFFDTYARTAHGVDAVVDPPQQAKGDNQTRLTEAQASVVKGLPGVDHVDVRHVEPLALLDAKGKAVTNFHRIGWAVSTDGDPRLRGFDVDGTAPGPGEALVDKETAAHQRITKGSTITVLDHTGARRQYHVSGLMDFGVSQAFSGSSVVGLPAAELIAATGSAAVDQIAVAAKPGVSQEEMVASLTAAVPGGARVRSGDQMRTDLANSATQIAGQFTFILLIFGGIALIVAIFVIYNTFAILLAQRIRETALLRCVGATRRQIFANVVLESVVIGLAGGAIGVLGGIGVVYGILGLLNGLLRVGIPVHTPVIALPPVLIGLALGLTVTVLSALLPAIRATRTSPLAALRDLPTVRVSSRTRRLVRAGVAAVFGAAGLVLTYRGWVTPDPQAGTLILITGGIITFFGVLVLSPLFIGPLSALVGLPARGTPGRLAVANARRNPGRTAVTTATLMIGVGMMALFSVILGSVRATAHERIMGNYPVDYVMTPVRTGNGEGVDVIPQSYVASLRGRSEFPGVVVTRVVTADIDGIPGRVGAIDGTIALGNVPHVPDGTALLTGQRTGLLGREIKVGKENLTVTSSAIVPIPGAEQVELLVSWAELQRLAGPGGYATVMAKAGNGITSTQSRDVIDTLTEPYPAIEVNSMADLADDFESTVNGLVLLFAGLLGTAVLIALFGIANTLSLSVVERTRESATLRAIGLTRGQLRATLVLEAVIMGLIGALVGVVYGVVYGRLVIGKIFTNIHPHIVIPWTWIAGLIGLAALASSLAALLPARRAAKASIVSAMADT